jgi:hypothetical protein
MRIWEAEMKSLLPIFIVTVQSALSATAPFDQQISNAKQEILSGAYADAGYSISQVRNGIATLGVTRRNYQAMQLAGLRDPSDATKDMVLNALADASAKRAQNDTQGTIQALDVALMATNCLLTGQAPAQRLAFSQAALQRVVAAKTSGTLLDPYLHRAAADAFSAGQYDLSLGFAEQIVSLVRLPTSPTNYLHLAHTIAGLDHLAKGEGDLAVSELNSSAAQFGDGSFIPSMALASALVTTRPAEVARYLDAAGKMEKWHAHAQAVLWKAQVQSGQVPDFGPLLKMGL